MPETEKTCFIIMPITTPSHLVDELYHRDADHFDNVLSGLFEPAIEKAGFKPIPPSAEGADVIQAEIIKNLETADLVLCDISTLNPNVFFELGIRTAVNKPACMVRDQFTKKIPFDTSIINCPTYDPHPTWTRDDEVDKLSKLLNTSFDRSSGRNSLWKYFGLRSVAKPPELGDPMHQLAEKMDMMMKMLSSRGNRHRRDKQVHTTVSLDDPTAVTDEVCEHLIDISNVHGVFLRENQLEIDHERIGPRGRVFLHDRIRNVLAEFHIDEYEID